MQSEGRPGLEGIDFQEKVTQGVLGASNRIFRKVETGKGRRIVDLLAPWSLLGISRARLQFLPLKHG